MNVRSTSGIGRVHDAGLLVVFGCISADTPVHIYGFNWSAKNYFTHKMGTEELIVRELAKQYNVEIHSTACQGLRTCKESCDDPEYQIQFDGEGTSCRKT
jgi:hypothetical protein